MAIPVITPLYNKFFGEKQGYTPDKSLFQYQGTGEGQFQNLGQEWGNKGAPQADYQNALESRGLGMKSRNEQALAIENYKKLLANPNMSAAQGQLRLGTDQNINAMMAAARSGAPGSSAGAMRNALGAGAQAQAQTSGQAAVLRAQEQQGAMSGLMQAATAQRAADLQAQGLDAQMAQYQASLEMQQRGLNAQTMLGFYGMGQNASMAQLQAWQNLEAMKSGQYSGTQQVNQQQNAALLGLVGTGITAGATVAGKPQTNNYYPPQTSDERSKEKIQQLEDHNRTLMDRLQSALSPQPRQMGRAPMPRSDAKARVKDEASAAEYGARWLEQNRQAAMTDAAAVKAYQDRLAAANTQLQQRQKYYAQTGPINENYLYGTPIPQPQPQYDVQSTPRPGVTRLETSTPIPPEQQAQLSDERSKRKIRSLEGALARATGSNAARDAGNLGGEVGLSPGAAYFGYGQRATEQRPGIDAGVGGGVTGRMAASPFARVGRAAGGYGLGGAAGIGGQAYEGASPDLENIDDIQRASESITTEPEATDAVNALQPISYEYKPEFKQYGQGRQFGISAQQLASTPAGARAVVPGPKGMLAVDPGKASTLALAATASQEHRLRALEDEYKRRLGGRKVA